MLARRPFLRGCLLLSSVFICGSAAASSFPIIAEAPGCRVTLTKASYDDPDGDDAEFLELYAERLVLRTVDAGRPDAAIPSDASSSAASMRDGSVSSDSGVTLVRTLGDCGLASIELVNGGSGACDKYRTLLVADVRVPEDGHVVVCAIDSSLAAAGKCDVSTLGTTTLKNGWLQNGPNDGMRFLGTSAEVLSEVGYEGGPACFTSAARLVDETGMFSSTVGPAEDDVNVLCSGQYRLVAASAAPAGDPYVCTAGMTQDGGSADAAAAPPPAASGGTPWVPEYAPPTSFGGGGADGSGGTRVSSLPQAGATGSVPSPPSCSVVGGALVAPPRHASPMALALSSSWLVRAWVRRRRLQPRARRARSRAHSGSSLPRSP